MDKKKRGISPVLAAEHLEDELSRVLESYTIPTLVISREHKVIHWNAAMEALTGVRKKDIVGTNKQWTVFYGKERPILADLIVNKVTDEEIERMYRGKYVRSRLIPGAYEGSDFFSAMGHSGKWLEYTAAPLKNSKGEMIGALETARDIGDQKEVEHKLLESEEKYRTVVEASSQNISIVDRNGVFKFLNIAAANALKGGPEDLIGKSMHDLFPKETADSHMRAIRAAIGTGTFIKAESSDVMKGVRRWYDTSIQPLKNSSGEYDSALVIANDITDRKLFEEQIRSFKEFSENIVESTPVGIIVVDREKRITACNKAEEALFGAGKKDLIGKRIYEEHLGNISDVMEQELEKTLHTGKTVRRPGIEYRDESGRNIILDISISPLFSGAEITGAVIATDDVTEKRKLKERVRMLERKDLPLTDKDKLVLHGLVAYPELNDIELAKKTRMKRSTLTGIKNKLARTGFYTTVIVPNLPALGYELLTINYGNYAPQTDKDMENTALREELCQPESIRIISTGIEFLTMCVSRNITEYRRKRDPIEAIYEREGALKDSHTIHFPFELSTIKNLFDYGSCIGTWFHLKSGGRSVRLPAWKTDKSRRLTENESILIYAFTKYPGLSDKEISNMTGLNKVTVGHTRKRLFEEGFISTLRLPDLNKLGCELMLLTHMEFNPSTDSAERESIMAKELPQSATYISDMREAISVTPYKDYTEYKTMADKYIRIQEKSRIFLKDPQELLIPIKKIAYNRIDFAPLIKKALNLKADY